MVEKLDTKLLLAACMAVTIRMRAKIPKAIITTVIAVRNRLVRIFFQERERISPAVITVD
jgi:hypothetical protein